MKEYLMNLCRALFGNDPYKDRLNDLRWKYDKADENVRSLREMYLAACEKWSEADKQAAELQARLDEKERELQRMQTSLAGAYRLIENLRDRNRDHEATIADYQAAMNRLTKEISDAMGGDATRLKEKP